jgi:hypothetical protein
MSELQFKHIKKHESFMFMTGIYIKLSATKAVGLFGNVSTFKKNEEVSKIKSLNVSSFQGASTNVKYDKANFLKYRKQCIEDGNV